jgi:hypothetical protein
MLLSELQSEEFLARQQQQKQQAAAQSEQFLEKMEQE